MFLPEGNASAKAPGLEGRGFKESRKSLCGWSIASEGHSFIEVVGDANRAKSWGTCWIMGIFGLLIAALEPRSG